MITTITKEKIANMLKARLGLSTIICEELIDQLFSNIQDIAGNQRFTIVDFGSFYSKVKKSRPGMNFHTKKMVTIPEKQVMRFIPAKKLKSLINEHAG